MLTHEENELLCRVEGAAPMGQMLRRYWIPAALSSELVAGGTPRRTRLFGENLIAFRVADGSVGVLDENCPHRGASLALARNENCALTCIYHGWRVAPDGRVVETPAEPPEHGFADRVRARSYPCYEDGGIVWAYLGPAGTEPARMHFGWMSAPDSHRMVVKVYENCNWVQCLEGVIDTAHSNILHTNLIKPAAVGGATKGNDDGASLRPSADPAPRIECDNTAYGFRYAAIRKPLADADAFDYVRVSLFIAPFYALFPNPVGWTYMQAFVPIDDTHTMFMNIQTKHDEPITESARTSRLRRGAMEIGVDLDQEYRKIRTRENNWLQDRAAMQAGNYTGIHGTNNEDIAVQESMGPIYDRTKEHLGASDIAVIRMRRLMLDGVDRFTSGAPPVGLAEPVAYETLRAEERMIPKGNAWQGELVG